MKTKSFKKIAIAALFVLAATFTAFGCSFNENPSNVQAQTIEINHVLESKIALNTEIEVASSISVEFNGTHTATNGVVVFPDGKIVNAGKLKLNQAGVYQLRYFFEYLGVTHTAVQNIEVYSDHFNLSNPAGGEIIVSDEENQLYTQQDGIIVNLKSGTSFVYNKVLDLRECGEDGLSNIIELDTRYGHFDENGKYVRDVELAWVRLTDCYNPNIYIDLRMQNSDLYTGCLYPGVKTNNQVVTGMDKGVTQVLGSSRIIILDGLNYRVWQKEGSMNVGMYNMQTKLTTGCIWKYDMQTQRIYLTYNDKENFLVTDLDEPLIYTNGVFFPGFTTGEVYLTIHAEGYVGTNARTEIISIGNDNLKAVANEACVDTFAPVVTVNANKTTQTGVYGAIGDTFTIPSASAIDVNLVDGIDVAVYRGYNTDMQLNVSVENNKFKLSEKDLYTIVYTARDKNGNEGHALFTVSTLETPDNKAITLSTLPDQTIEAGAEIKDLYDVTNAINMAKENVNVKIAVESANQCVEGEGEDFSFTPYYAGNYVVTFSYSDGVFTYEKKVNLKAEASSNVCFMDEVISPNYYVQGDSYGIESINAYTFVNGRPEAVNTSVYAVFDDGAEQLVSNTSAVKMTGNESVYFVYRAQGVSYTTGKTGIINADYFNQSGTRVGYDMGKLFVGDYSYVATNDRGTRIKNITFTSNKTSGNNKLSYFNAISGRKFTLEYKVVAGEANFETLRVRLTDASNADNQLIVDIFNNTDSAYYSINGGLITKAELISFSNATINISYDYESKFLRVGSYSSLIDFDASQVYLDVELMGINGKSSIIVSKINNTPISGNSYKDTMAPEIYVTDFQGDYVQGDIVKVNQPEFADVLTGINYAKASLSIRCSDGKPVLDKNGKALTNVTLGNEYEILLDRIAVFYVVYEVYDFGGNSAKKTIVVNCADDVAPTIELHNISEDKILVVKAGEQITFNFTVSDNVTATKSILVYIHLYCEDMFSFVPNVSNIKENRVPADGVYSEKFVIEIRGNYTAQIHAYDKEGNLCVKNISIIVK